MIDGIIKIISAAKLPVTDEKELQLEIEKLFVKNGIPVDREFRIDEKNIPDFFIDGIAIEIKIKGNAKKIYKQCERYCGLESVRNLIFRIKLLAQRYLENKKTINSKEKNNDIEENEFIDSIIKEQIDKNELNLRPDVQ